MNLQGSKTTKQGLLGSPLAAHSISLGVFHAFSDSLSRETVWKIAGWLLDCGSGVCTVSKMALFGILLPTCRAPSWVLIRISRQSLEEEFSEVRVDEVLRSSG